MVAVPQLSDTATRSLPKTQQKARFNRAYDISSHSGMNRGCFSLMSHVSVGMKTAGLTGEWYP